MIEDHLVGDVASHLQQLISDAEVSAAENSLRAAVLAALAAGRHANTTWYQQWTESLQADGTLTRMVR